MELLCPAGNLSSLKSAIDNGADAVYIGLRNDTNARHFEGLNFTRSKLEQAVKYVREHHRKLHMAINTFASADQWDTWKQSVDLAASIGVDALIVADISVLDYAAKMYPQIELHLSVQASATNAEAINYYQNNFNVKRVVLPRVLSIHQVKQLARATDVELEVFAYGSLCIMAEGRCHLSSYLTGESPNMNGVCSPAKYVDWKETDKGLESRLNNILIDRYAPDEAAGYPTLCKGRFNVDDNLFHALEEPTSLNSMALLPELLKMGISAVKIEGRQRSSAYVKEVTQAWRQAIDACKQQGSFVVEQRWQQKLANLSEGNQTTLGAYHKSWQ
ncbi:ubiquinone anaerobic biosynthesis protein UbiU [Thalassotalea ganghwensis]